MTPKQILVAVILAIATILVLIYILSQQKIISALGLKPKSNSHDPRTWSISADDAAIINSMNKLQQDQLASDWTKQLSTTADPLHDGEALYKQLLQTYR